MARKLSNIARPVTILHVAGFVLLAANALFAQSEAQTAESPRVINNPFITAQPQPAASPEAQPQSQSQAQSQLHLASKSQPASEPQPNAHRRPIAYQNPFAAASKAPPVDTSLRPGPISRWRHPIIAGNDASGVKTAMLAPPAPEPPPSKWDLLPPGDDLRNHTATLGKETDPTFYARLTAAPTAIQFTPKPLTQPTWLTDFDEVAVQEARPIRVDAAVFNLSLGATNFANQTAALTPAPDIALPGPEMHTCETCSVDSALAKADVAPSIVANCVETTEGWLEQAQHAAKGATSLEELSAVVESCERGLRGTPDEKQSSSLRRLSAWAHNRRGEILADADRADESLNDFQSAISLDPSCSLAIHNRAVTLAQQNQFAAALRDFNRVIELNPGLAVAYRNRAELLAALGRTEEAIRDYSQALETSPNDAHLFRDRAYAYQQLGQFSKSLADFNRAIDIAPDDPDALTQRGNFAAEQGNYEQALTDFQQALAKNPSWAEAHRSLAWLEATCPNPSLQNPQEAVAAAERAAKLAPANDYLILDTLAAAHASAGHFDRASDLQRQALAGAPPEAATSLKQRLALYQRGQAFRNVPAPASDLAPPDPSTLESNPPSDHSANP